MHGFGRGHYVAVQQVNVLSLKRTEMLSENNARRCSGKTRVRDSLWEAGILSVSPCIRIEDVFRILCSFITIPLVDKS